jgi:phage terminase small subunit
MPVLSNPRHERFAQGLAAGKSAEEAYSEAGFKPSPSNASTLRKNQNILERVSELLSEQERRHGQATAEAIKAAALTKEWVIETLMDNVAKAMQAKPVRTDDEGEAIGEYQYQGGVANRALELLGKELGMFIERRQNIPASADLTDEHLDQRIRQLLGIVGEAGTDRTSGAEEAPSGPQSIN